MTKARAHWNWRSGKRVGAKIGYRTWPEAKAAATRRTEEEGVAISPYACSTCSRFHVGRSKESIRIQRTWLKDLEVELGERVLAHLGAENLGNPARRKARIAKRFVSAERVRRRDYSGT